MITLTGFKVKDMEMFGTAYYSGCTWHFLPPSLVTTPEEKAANVQTLGAYNYTAATSEGIT